MEQKGHMVTGGGGLQLHVVEAGNVDGQPLLFLHTFSACRLSWNKQLESDLTNDFRLVAMDLRGHGFSEKPPGVYGESKLWAEDVHAVIAALHLDRPVVVGHGYGGLVLCDYLRFHGDEHLGAIALEGSVTSFGTQEATAMISDEILALSPGLFSSSVDESTHSLATLVRLCGGDGLSESDFYFWFGFTTLVPPYVREGMMKRVLDNDAILKVLDVPALITHGAKDATVYLSAPEHNVRIIPNATLSVYEDSGHTPHWQHPQRFNTQLRAFVGAL